MTVTPVLKRSGDFVLYSIFRRNFIELSMYDRMKENKTKVRFSAEGI